MAREIAYVRTEMLDEKAPPASSVGIRGWIKENLFSSVGNSILTVISVFFIYMVLSGILPWVFLGIWNADSLSHCREIFAERYGDGVEYACWAVIRDRWHQIIFGYFAPSQYWRPILGFILIMAALAPILYPSLPRKSFLISFASLFIYPWLIWGGSIWGPLATALGAIIGILVYRFAAEQFGSLIGLIAACAAARWVRGERST